MGFYSKHIAMYLTIMTVMILVGGMTQGVQSSSSSSGGNCVNSLLEQQCTNLPECLWIDSLSNDGYCMSVVDYCVNQAIEHDCSVSIECEWNENLECNAKCSWFVSKDSCISTGTNCGWNGTACVDCEEHVTADTCLSNTNCGWNGNAKTKCIACTSDYSGNCSGAGGFYGCGINFHAPKFACGPCDALSSSWCDSSFQSVTQNSTWEGTLYTGNNISCRLSETGDCVPRNPTQIEFHTTLDKGASQKNTSHELVKRFLAEHAEVVKAGIDDDGNKKLGIGIGIGIGISAGILLIVYVLHRSGVINNKSVYDIISQPSAFNNAM